MKFFSKLLVGAALTAAATVSAQGSVTFMELEDNARVMVKRTVDGNGNSSYSISNANSALLSHNNDLSCNTNTNTPIGADAHCSWTMTLKTDYAGVPFSQFDELNSVTSAYGYVDGVNPEPYIDLSPTGLWAFNRTHLADVGTLASTSETNFDWAPSSQTSINIAMTTAPGVPGTDKQIIVTMAMYEMMPGVTEQYQGVQIIASGIPNDLPLYQNGQALGPNYYEATGNKGQLSLTNPGILAWYVTHWSVSGGHYGDLRLFTNGTSRYDQGIDLSDYSSVEVTLQCSNNMVLETFLGTTDDSSQNFLGDIQCGTQTQTETFNISGFNNLHDIQSALWFHAPTWKNGAVAGEWSLFINIHEAIIKR